jgi:hypothetical protein
MRMTKTLSMLSHKNYDLNANEGFVTFLTSKLSTCFIDGFTLKMKSQSITCLLNKSEHAHIGFWTLKMKCTQYGLYGQAAFKNARAILFFEFGRSRQERRMGFTWAVKEACPMQAPTLGKCDLAWSLKEG